MRRVRQDNFSLGQFAVGSSPEKLPPGACLTLTNMVVDDEGSLRRRGGCEYVTSDLTAFDLLPRVLWDGFLAGGQRTAMFNADGLFAVDAAGTGAEGPIGLDAIVAANPQRPAVIGGMLVLGVLGGGSSLPSLAVYAGTRKTADYATGTVTTTLGSATVTGVGTSWLANVDPGMLFMRQTGPTTVFIPVKRVNSNTSLELESPWPEATAAGVTYVITRTLVLPVQTYVSARYTSTTDVPIVAVVAGRLVVATRSNLFLSDPVDPDVGTPMPFVFSAVNVHALPTGAEVVAMAPLGDRLFVFTTAGVFIVSGLAQPIVGPDGSPQHRIDQYSQDVVALRGGAGITTWRDALVVPASDDIYLMDGFARPVPISGSARAEWRLLVSQGYQPGGAAVYRGHYVMPVLFPQPVSAPEETAWRTWLFRLDRMAETRAGLVAPWVMWTDQAGAVGAVAVRRGVGGVDGGDRLFGAGWNGATRTRARVLDLSDGFATGATNEDDAAGADVVATIEPQDFRGGRGALWRYLRLRYRLRAGGGTTPGIQVDVATGGDVTVPVVTHVLPNAAGEDYAHDANALALQTAAEFLRVTLYVTGGTEFVLHEVEAEFMENRRVG